MAPSAFYHTPGDLEMQIVNMTEDLESILGVLQK
jgi:hypothetical protein